nr:MAG TPA: hypothetical protein [Caudoviricetes sp.]
MIPFATLNFFLQLVVTSCNRFFYFATRSAC